MVSLSLSILSLLLSVYFGVILFGCLSVGFVEFWSAFLLFSLLYYYFSDTSIFVSLAISI